MSRVNRASRPTTKGKPSERGRGRGDAYDPHLHIQDVPSSGRASRVKGVKTGRLHHFLSKLELTYFWILEWSTSVVDIREQYPLDLEETLAVADSLGIRHPSDRKTQQPVPLTTDFVITRGTAGGVVDQARTVKNVEHLSSKRVMEKFEVERVYWERRNIDWGIVTEREIDFTLAANVEKAFFYHDPTKLSPFSHETINRIEAELTSKAIRGNLPLRDITRDCEKTLSLPAGSGSKVILHLLANRRWLVDMSQPICMTKPIVFTSMPVLYSS